MSEFHCLVVVLFSVISSCFLHDLFEFQDMFCLTKHGATFSSLNMSRRTYCSSYDEHACDAIIFPLMLKTEESISEIDSHHILQRRPTCDHVIIWVSGSLSSHAC